MKYLVPETNNPSKFVIIEASGFVPENSIPLPLEFYGEEDEWLVVTEVEGEFGEPKKEISVNEELKAQILAQREVAKQSSDRLAMRTQKRNFGERLIDEISLLNEDAEVSLEGLEAIIMDPDLILIRELLWTGSIKSAHAKLVELETKCVTVFGQTNYDAIKAKMEEFLQSIGEL
jgi:hypothetical protein